jgi:hypothetical protein
VTRNCAEIIWLMDSPPHKVTQESVEAPKGRIVQSGPHGLVQFPAVAANAGGERNCGPDKYLRV